MNESLPSAAKNASEFPRHRATRAPVLNELRIPKIPEIRVNHEYVVMALKFWNTDFARCKARCSERGRFEKSSASRRYSLLFILPSFQSSSNKKKQETEQQYIYPLFLTRKNAAVQQNQQQLQLVSTSEREPNLNRK